MQTLLIIERYAYAKKNKKYMVMINIKFRRVYNFIRK